MRSDASGGESMLIKANGNNNWASLDEQFQITLLVLNDLH